MTMSSRMGATVRTVNTLETTAGGRFSGSRNTCYKTENQVYNAAFHLRSEEDCVKTNLFFDQFIKLNIFNQGPPCTSATQRMQSLHRLRKNIDRVLRQINCNK